MVLRKNSRYSVYLIIAETWNMEIAINTFSYNWYFHNVLENNGFEIACHDISVYNKVCVSAVLIVTQLDYGFIYER